MRSFFGFVVSIGSILLFAFQPKNTFRIKSGFILCEAGRRIICISFNISERSMHSRQRYYMVCDTDDMIINITTIGLAFLPIPLDVCSCSHRPQSIYLAISVFLVLLHPLTIVGKHRILLLLQYRCLKSSSSSFSIVRKITKKEATQR